MRTSSHILFLLPAGCTLLAACGHTSKQSKETRSNDKPNVIYLISDDLGIGDLSCYGATQISTPNLDRLAGQGLQFTNAYATSSTSTPSRFGLLTGMYPWRQKNTGIAPGNSELIIDTACVTMADMFQAKGYATAAIGKWHLGLGPKGGTNFNGLIKPNTQDIPQTVELKGTPVSADTALIRYPFRIRVHAGRAVVMDLHGSDSFLHAFGLPGFRHQASFGRRGEGPEEQLSLENIRWVGDTLYALDSNKSELARFAFGPSDASPVRCSSVGLDKELLRALDFVPVGTSSFFIRTGKICSFYAVFLRCASISLAIAVKICHNS